MNLTFTPIRCDTELRLSVDGDALILNGERLDLGPLPDGATIPAAAVDSDWVAGDISRSNGTLCVPLKLPHGANAPHETRFPVGIVVTHDGPVDLPAYETPTPLDAEEES